MSARELAVQVLADWIDARELDFFHDVGGKNPTFEPDDFLPDAGKALAALNAAGLVVVRAEDVDGAVDCMTYMKDSYFWTKHRYQEPFDNLTAALADQSGGDHE